MCNLSADIEEKDLAKDYAKAYAEGYAEACAEGYTKAYAKAYAKGYAEGYAEGVTKAYLACIRCLMEKMSMSAEKAMSVLSIPEAERPKYLELLEQKA